MSSELEEIFEKLNFDGDKFREWIEGNTTYTHCDDLSGDCFVLYNDKLYLVNFAEFVIIEEVDLSDKERIEELIDHLENHNDDHAKKIIEFLKSLIS